jgi:hypothetical protein
MQNYYYQILVNGQPWENLKIYNMRSAEAHLKHITDHVTHHIDYKDKQNEVILIKVEEVTR